MKRLSNNTIIAIVLLVVVVVLGGFVYSQEQDIRAALDEEQRLNQDISALDRQIASLSVDEEQERRDAILVTTGLDMELVEIDERVAREFFEPAFSWTSGDEYEEIRLEYIELLGEGNSFNEGYLPPDIKIELSDGHLYRIDHYGMRVTMDDFSVVPLRVEGENRIRYVAFVRFFSHRDREDLNNPSALDASSAIIEYTVSGDDADRVVSEVTAYPGMTEWRSSADY